MPENLIDRLLSGYLDQPRSYVIQVTVGDGKLVAGHRLTRKPDDPVDVSATGCDRVGNCSERSRTQRGSDHRDD